MQAKHKQQPLQIDEGAQRMLADLIKWWGLPAQRSATKVFLRCLTIVHSSEAARRELQEFREAQRREAG